MRLSLHRATASGLGIKGYVPRFRSFRSLFRSLRFLSIYRLSQITAVIGSYGSWGIDSIHN